MTMLKLRQLRHLFNPMAHAQCLCTRSELLVPLDSSQALYILWFTCLEFLELKYVTRYIWPNSAQNCQSTCSCTHENMITD